MSPEVDRHKTLAAVYVVLLREGKVFLLRRANTGYRDGDWEVPAGHLEEGETLRQAAVREAKEEASVILAESDVRLSHVAHRHFENQTYIDCYFVIQKWRGTPQIGEPHKCSRLGWFAIDSLPANLIPYEAEGLRSSLQNVPYSEFGWR